MARVPGERSKKLTIPDKKCGRVTGIAPIAGTSNSEGTYHAAGAENPGRYGRDSRVDTREPMGLKRGTQRASGKPSAMGYQGVSRP